MSCLGGSELRCNPTDRKNVKNTKLYLSTHGFLKLKMHQNQFSGTPLLIPLLDAFGVSILLPSVPRF